MNKIKLLFKTILGIFIPPLCMKCGKIVENDGTLCDDCYKTITFFGEGMGFCYVCGNKIASAFTEYEICAKCLSTSPKYSKLRSAIKYNGHSKQMILGFKHGDKTEYAKPFATWMVRAYKDIDENDIVIPIPLHPKRLLKRKYNQAALLSQEISKLINKPWDGKILKRKIHTKPQGHFRAKMRLKNVKNAFYINHQDKIKGKTVLLIDDVFTTGATTNECIGELLRYGAKSVNVLVIAKT